MYLYLSIMWDVSSDHLISLADHACLAFYRYDQFPDQNKNHSLTYQCMIVLKIANYIGLGDYLRHGS